MDRLKPQGTFNTTVGQDGPPLLLNPLLSTGARQGCVFSLFLYCLYV